MGIVEVLNQINLKNSHVFWPRSSQARTVIKDFLFAKNIAHTTCMLYDPAPRIPTKPPTLTSFDEIVFTSPSTVNAFLEIFGSFPSNAKLIAIGPITAQFLEGKKLAQQKD